MYQKKEFFAVSIQEIPRMKKIIESTLVEWGVKQDDLADIVLACDEAATNIIVHAYGHLTDSAKQKEKFEMNLRKKGKVVGVILKDNGSGFDISHVPLPNINENLAGRRKGGFGIHLMRTLMSRIRYRCLGRENKTILLKVLSS